ncbi:MAG: hypothetical protein ACWA5A_08315 [Marinibacterium sp.]
MADVKLKIVLDDKHPADDANLGRALEAAGVQVETQIPEIGVVFGKADKSRIEGLRQLEGVIEVEQEDEIQLPPPSDDTPQ